MITNDVTFHSNGEEINPGEEQGGMYSRQRKSFGERLEVGKNF